MNTNCFKGDWIQVTWILFFINPIYNFTCLSVHLSRSWKLSPRTRGPKNYSGPRVLTSVSAHQLPKTDVVDAAISKLPLLSFCICSFPITSQSMSRSWKLSLQTRGPKNYSGPRVLTFVSAQQLSEMDVVDAAISKLPLLSFCICSFPITSQSPSSLCFLFVSVALTIKQTKEPWRWVSNNQKKTKNL
jgi:hypothetical protein